MTEQGTQVVDQAETEAFVGKVIGDASGMFATLLASIGDRLGLFKDLAANGPATSVELAAHAGVNERYAREWLGGMASAGYLEYDPVSSRFTLPVHHAPALADEGGPAFFGGAYQELLGMLRPLDLLIDAFRHGGGVPESAYGDDMWDGMERFGASLYNNVLVQQWIPAMPDVQAKLERGAEVADVGCGRGRALIKLAQAFPDSRFVGYDVFGPALDRAIAYAEEARVADRVRFEQLDALQGLLERYDVITTFDVVHDVASPHGLLSVIRGALEPDGVYVCLDANVSDRLEENLGPVGTVHHGVSVLYCMTTSLAHDGEGLGRLGLHEQRLRELCTEAGFGSVRRVPLEDPLNSLYEIKLQG